MTSPLLSPPWSSLEPIEKFKDFVKKFKFNLLQEDTKISNLLQKRQKKIEKFSIKCLKFTNFLLA